MNLLDGQKFIKQKQFGKALEIFSNLEKKTSDPRVIFYLGLINFELNNFKKSISYYNKYLKKNPKSTATLINLAIVLQTIGELDKSKNIYIKLIEINKFDIRPYYGLFNINSKNLTNRMFENLYKIKEFKNLSFYELGILDFLLSKKEKLNKKYDEELNYLKSSHQKIFNSNFNYNMSSQFYYNKIIGKNFDKITTNLEKITGTQNFDIYPIFIIGLPRSGSTLVESILTSTDEKINSYGESHVVNMSILDQIGSKIYKANFDEKLFKFQINLEVLNESILNKYSEYNKKGDVVKIFVDKSLENFFNIDLICKIYPNAKFLHTFRNPTDAAISIFQSMLPDLSWTHSIEDILNYIDNYFKVINFYKKKYPHKILDVELENLTNNSQKVSKSIIKFSDLTWKNEILKFYERKNLYSKTLSFSQIRSKVTKYNSNQYKQYFYILDDYKEKFNWLVN